MAYVVKRCQRLLQGETFPLILLMIIFIYNLKSHISSIDIAHIIYHNCSIEGLFTESWGDISVDIRLNVN